MENIVKNPIVIGLVAGVLTYMYMYWEEDKKRKKNPKAKHRSINIVTPGVVTIIAWFIASSYLDTKSSTDTPIQVNNTTPVNRGSDVTNQQILGTAKPVTQNATNTFYNKGGVVGQESQAGQDSSLHRIQKNSIRLPPSEVFIDMVPF